MIAKKYRIDRNLIDYILKKGDSFTSKLFIIRYTKNDKRFCRYRTIVSKKIYPKAVKRNHLRRKIYEAVRSAGIEDAPKTHLDIMLIPKKRIINAKYKEIENDIKETIPKLWTN